MEHGKFALVQVNRDFDAEISALNAICFKDTYAAFFSETDLLNVTEETCLSRRRDFFNKNSSANTVAVYVERILVGFFDFGRLDASLQINCMRDVESSANVGQIYKMYLLRAYQNCGLGKKMMMLACDQFARGGIFSFVTICLTGNATACYFYTNQGGKLIGRTIINMLGSRQDANVYLFVV